MVDLGHVEAAAPLDGEPTGFLFVLEGCRGRLEVARVGEAVGTDGTAVGQCELGTVVLAHKAARRAVDEFNLAFDPARDDADLARAGLDPAELGEEAHSALLRYDQHLAVGVVEIVALHRLGDEIDVGRHASLGVDVAGRRHGAHAREKRELLLRHRHGAPTQLADRAVVLAK